MKRLASLAEVDSAPFRSFMAWVNAFAVVHELRVHTNWSKIWEYPWSFQHLGLDDLAGRRVLDIGSELSPMPWFFASLGDRVTLVETDEAHVPTWAALRATLGFDLDWAIVTADALPMAEFTC